MNLRSMIRGKILEIASTFSGDPQGKGNLAGIYYDQRNGLGNVPYNANVNYAGVAVIMTVAKFLACVPRRPDRLDKEAVELVLSNKGIGSPFLSVDFSKLPPKVVGHEGRGRALAIEEAYNSKTPLLVHIFPTGGDRARHLTKEQLNALYKGIEAEKTKAVVSSPITPIVWWLEKWQSVA